MKVAFLAALLAVHGAEAFGSYPQAYAGACSTDPGTIDVSAVYAEVAELDCQGMMDTTSLIVDSIPKEASTGVPSNECLAEVLAQADVATMLCAVNAPRTPHRPRARTSHRAIYVGRSSCILTLPTQ